MTRKELAHFLPILLLICGIIYYLFKVFPNQKVTLVAESYVLRISAVTVFAWTVHALLLAYIIGTLHLFLKYRKNILGLYSNIEQLDLSWFLFVYLTFIIMWLLNIGVIVQSYFPGIKRANIIALITSSLIINLIFVVLIVFKGLQHAELFNGIQKIPKINPPQLAKEKIDSYADQFKNHLVKNKPYLEPLLTVSDVAQQLSIPPRHLSQAINRTFNKNFFDIISDYRIDEAKKMLKDPLNPKKSILQICYDAGFNSKSSFNSLFKKKTGLTPSQFRKK